MYTGNPDLLRDDPRCGQCGFPPEDCECGDCWEENMTEETQRIAIAEACGWEHVEGFMGWPPDPNYNRTIWGEGHRELPDYLHDLNACHEMEKVLEPDQQYTYGMNLARMTINDPDFDDDSFVPNGFGWFVAIHATPAQRCEAFLRTIGKWI